jgi:hypothetical protein
VVFNLGALEKVKLYEARHLLEMGVSRQPDVLESCFGTFDDFEAVHCNEHLVISLADLGAMGPSNLGQETTAVNVILTAPSQGSAPGIQAGFDFAAIAYRFVAANEARMDAKFCLPKPPRGRILST